MRGECVWGGGRSLARRTWHGMPPGRIFVLTCVRAACAAFVLSTKQFLEAGVEPLLVKARDSLYQCVDVANAALRDLGVEYKESEAALAYTRKLQGDGLAAVME